MLKVVSNRWYLMTGWEAIIKYISSLQITITSYHKPVLHVRAASTLTHRDMWDQKSLFHENHDSQQVSQVYKSYLTQLKPLNT